MADAIVIKIGLDASDIGNAQGKIRASVKSALDSALPDAKEIGKKIGNAFADGMAEGIAKARQLRTQLDQILSPVARQRTNESAEVKHQQKLNEIRERGAQQQASIAAKAAAQEATIRAKAAADAERDARRFAEAQARIAGRGAPPDSAIAFFKRYSSTIREAGESIQQAGYGLLGLTAGILNVGKSAVTSAVNIDRQVNVLKALTGSAAEAEKRFASLTKLASQTPGLTTSLAATLDAQLRVANVSGNTIDKLLPAIGRLNAVSPLGDPQKFAQNLVQLITQGFERADLKELVGQSPLAGEIIKSIFNVDSPTNGKAIKEAAQKLGITTTDAFFSAFAQAAQNNPKLAGITESLGTQFEKLQDRILVALRPLGLSIVEALKPLVDSAVPIIEKLSAAFSALPQSAQQAIIILAGLTAAIGPLVIALGGLIQTVGAIGNLITVISALATTATGATGAVSGLGAAILGLNPILLGVGVAIAAGTALWIGYGKTMGDIKDRFATIEQQAARARGEITLLDGTIQKTSDQKFQLNQPADPRLKGLKVGGGQVVDFGNAVKVGADGRPINPAENLAFNAAVAGIKTGRIGGGSGESAESKARQLREAQLNQQKVFIEQNQRLLEDANKRELEQFKDLYDQKEITAQAFFAEKTRVEQSSISASIAATQQEIANAEVTLSKTKPGTVERIRLETELFKLRTDLTIKSREFYASEVENIQATTKALLDQRKEALDTLKGFSVKLDESQLPSALIAPNAPLPIQQQAAQRLTDAAKAAVQFREKDLELQQQEIQIQNAIAAGVLTESQGKEATLAVQRQYRDVLIQSLEIQKAAINPLTDGEAFQRINVQIEQLKTLGQSLSPTQAFFKGFRSEAETLAESFERIGKSFKDSVLGVVDSGIDKLTQKLGFFKSLVGDILKSLTRVLLGGLLQPRGGVTAAGGGGIGGILGSILGGGSGGGLGGFATGGFAGGGGAASILGGGGSGGGGILGTLINAVGGGGISAPRSLSLGGLPIAGSIPFPTSAIPGTPGGGAGGGLSSLFGGLGGGLSNLFKGIGFGKTAGSGGALAGALPLLGLSLGSSLGTDRLTSILGGAAGGLLGIGLSAAPGIIGAGGALSGLGFLAPLFSNPLTAIAAGLALPAIFLLGRARQRKRDEKTSGDALQDAVDQIKDIRKQVESNELTLNVSDARKLFDSQILQPFIAQISQLKSKSVRESRLKNQTVDLRNLFEKEVIPAVQAQKAKQGINDKLIPEFAFGGIVPGRPTPGIDSVLARLSPGEMVLTSNHQAALMGIAGRNVFQAIGVPNSGEAVGDGSTAFARGGFVGAASRQVTTPTINMTVQLVVSGDEAVEILNAAASTDSGQQILVNAHKGARRNRLTR